MKRNSKQFRRIVAASLVLVPGLRKNTMRSSIISRSLITLATLATMTVLLIILGNHSTPRVAAQGPLSCVVPPQGMVSWWPGEGGANDIFGLNSGIKEGTVTSASGKVGQAFKFNGNQSDGINLGDVAAFNFAPTDSFSIEAWINISALAVLPGDDVEIIVSLNYKCSPTLQALGITGTGKAFFDVRDANGVLGEALSPSALSLNAWHHLAAVRDVTGSGKMLKLFLDGVLVASTPDLTTGLLANNGPDYIGRKGVSCPTNNPFNGLIDEVSIYNRALAASEIQAIVNADSAGKCKPDADGDGVPDSLDACPGTPAGTVVNDVGCPVGQCVPPPAGMVSWLPGDGNANDIKGANNGALQNGVSFAAGQVGQAFLLDGIDDFVDLGNDPSLQVSAGDFTVDAWVRFNAVGHPPGANIGAPQGDMSILDKMSPSGTNTNGWRLLKQDDNHFWFCFGGGGGNGCVAGSATTVISTTSATTGTWFHVTAVKSSAEIAIYINGVKEASKPTPAFTDTHSANLRVGSYVLEDAHLNGLIDEVEIFNRALTTLEIQAIVNAGGVGKCKNRPPAAVCQNVTVSAGASCTANVSIDNGSYDPDGDTITLTQSPAGPYPLGNTTVTLTVTDSKGASSTCSATVTVVDTTPPTITPPANASYQCASQVPPGNHSQATATDNCSMPSITVADASNGGAGSTASPLVITRVFTATDAAGNSASAYQTITVIDPRRP